MKTTNYLRWTLAITTLVLSLNANISETNPVDRLSSFINYTVLNLNNNQLVDGVQQFSKESITKGINHNSSRSNR